MLTLTCNLSPVTVHLSPVTGYLSPFPERRTAWLGDAAGSVCSCFTLAMINYVDRVALSVASKPIAEEFGLSPVTMGYLFSSFLWTYLLCLIPMGILVDRLGTKTINAAGITLWSAATMLTGASWSFVSLIGTRLAMGVGEATTFPAGGRVVREWIPAGERGLSPTRSSWPGRKPVRPSARCSWRGSSARSAGADPFWSWAPRALIWLLAWLIWFDQPEKVTLARRRRARQDPARARRENQRAAKPHQGAPACWTCCALAPCGAWRWPRVARFIRSISF